MDVFDNTSLRAFFDEFGKRISAIVFDNKSIIYIGHKSSPVKTVDELELVTIGGVDLIGIPVTPTNPYSRESGAMFKYYHPTSFIQCICTVDADHEDYLVDPLNFG